MGPLQHVMRHLARVPGRREQQRGLRQRGPERAVLERDRAAAPLALRHHAIDVADADPVALERDRPLRVVARLRPREEVLCNSLSRYLIQLPSRLPGCS